MYIRENEKTQSSTLIFPSLYIYIYIYIYISIRGFILVLNLLKADAIRP